VGSSTSHNPSRIFTRIALLLLFIDQVTDFWDTLYIWPVGVRALIPLAAMRTAALCQGARPHVGTYFGKGLYLNRLCLSASADRAAVAGLPGKPHDDVATEFAKYLQLAAAVLVSDRIYALMCSQLPRSSYMLSSGLITTDYVVPYHHRLWDLISPYSMGYHMITDYGVSYHHIVWVLISSQTMGSHDHRLWGPISPQTMGSHIIAYYGISYDHRLWGLISPQTMGSHYDHRLPAVVLILASWFMWQKPEMW
jgi:hypothetical protein